jgi:hypothetical protein
LYPPGLGFSAPICVITPYSERTPSSWRVTGASHVASAAEGRQEEAKAYGQGKEVDQAAEEAYGRRGAIHQALTPQTRHLAG